MDIAMIGELISNFGFPVALVVALGAFIFKIYNDQQKKNKEDMEAVQARCKEREEKLYEEIKANREVNAEAIATIALYADSIKTIEKDIHEIKTDITILNTKIETN
jgi:preprotein translocase subunit YajC